MRYYNKSVSCLKVLQDLNLLKQFNQETKKETSKQMRILTNHSNIT